MFFIGSFDICVSSLLMCLFRSFVHFLTGLFSYWWVLRVLYIFCIIVLCQMCLLQIFYSSLWLVFKFFWYCLSRAEGFTCNEVQLIIISSMNCVFGVVSKKASWHPRSSRSSPMLSSGSFRCFAFYILVYGPFWVDCCEECKICV